MFVPRHHVGGEKVVVRAPSDDMDMLAVCDTFLGA
jgi:hypothetical protein